MFISGSIMKSISSEEVKGWRKFLHFCTSETTVFVKKGSDYSGSWVVRVTVNSNRGSATMFHELCESGSSSLTSLVKDYNKALEEAKIMFDGLNSEPSK